MPQCRLAYVLEATPRSVSKFSLRRRKSRNASDIQWNIVSQPTLGRVILCRRCNAGISPALRELRLDAEVRSHGFYGLGRLGCGRQFGFLDDCRDSLLIPDRLAGALP